MNRKLLKEIFLVLAGLPLAASSAMAQKQTPPAGGPPKAFTIPAHETYALPNGMKVTLIPYGNVPKVTLDLALRLGDINDPEGLAGLADITAQLMKEGTTTLSSSALAEATSRMGSSLGANVGSDQSSFSVDVLSEFGPDTPWKFR